MEMLKDSAPNSGSNDIVDQDNGGEAKDDDTIKSKCETHAEAVQAQCEVVQEDMNKMNLDDEESHGSMNLIIDEKTDESATNAENANQDKVADANSNSIEDNDVEMAEAVDQSASVIESDVNLDDGIQKPTKVINEGEGQKTPSEPDENDIEIIEKSITVIDLDDEDNEKESIESDGPEQIGIILESDEPIVNTDAASPMPELDINLAPQDQTPLETVISQSVETDAHMEKDKAIQQEETQTASKENVTDTDDKIEVVFFGKECINYECQGDCNRYFRAPEFVLNCYKIGRKVGKKQFVCELCYDKACKIYEEFAGILKSKQPMLLKNFSFHKQEFVEIDSSDEEVDDDCSDKEHFDVETLKLFENELENTVQSVLTKVEIQNQLTWSKTLLGNRLEQLERDTFAVATNLKSLQQKADKMHSSLYRWSKSRVSQETPLDLNTGRAYVLKGADLPPVGEVKRAPIIVNESYFAVKNKPIASWVSCKVIEEVDSAQSNVKLYKVKFLRSQYQLVKTVPAKHLAYHDPPNVRLPVGSRVIAYFDATSLSRGKEKLNIQSAYYPGIVAEPLKFGNNFRYLIFYDDGYTQYVYHKDVRLVCQASDNVWEDVHSGSREFIQKYLTEYLINRPMVQTSKGQTILTESNGKWLNAKVLEIDDSLILLQFDGGRCHTEWIYRGSMRLGPVYREYQQKNSLPVARTPRRTETFVSYEQDDENSSRQRKETPAPRAVAKKSVSRPADRSGPASTSSSGSQPVCLNSSTIYVDDDNKPRGKVVFYTAVRNKPPSTYSRHKCSPRCLFEVPYNLNGYSPLAKPLLSGWERMIYKQRSKKIVSYRGPCGRILRNMKDMHRYLRETQNVLNVDNFDYSGDINCLAEYVIENATVKKRDISGGQEKMAIPLVNYYDNSMPPACKYSSQRIPTEGVNLNLDQEFLVGCDCEDDCSDKSKCSCWQLTLEGAKYGNPNTPIDEVGYQYRRLLEHVPTGIYECNPRCKCKANCLNRVVQNFLQIKLQVFKTSNRGWGLRCLNDIPKGCFVCIYAGYLLTEAKANEGGKEIGDEYFAELDYIETAEQVKEGYESEVESSDPEDDDDSAAYEKDYDDDDFTPSKSFVPRPKKAQRLTRSSTTQSEDDSQERQVINFNPKSHMNDDNQKDSSMRKLFGKDEHCYVMDAKITGNLGRYFNHSCAPNLFVQNVFVDTHDLRFPWVAFFAASNIRAGTELTWNYNYEVGVVPGKVLYCQCGAPNCRVRLL